MTKTIKNTRRVKSHSMAQTKKSKNHTVKYYSHGHNQTKSRQFKIEDIRELHYEMSLENLNNKLQERSRDLFIDIGPVFSLPDNSTLIQKHGYYGICLYEKKGQTQKCISGIGFEVYTKTGDSKGYMEINSRTDDSKQKRGYNKFLRAVLIYLTPIIFGKDIMSINSIPENPLSAYTLMKYFDCKLSEELNSDFLNFKKQYQSKAELYTLITDAYQYGSAIYHIEIPLSKENIRSSKNIIDVFMDHVF